MENNEFWVLAAANQRFLKQKLCLAEEASDPCNSPIIRAHTIPRSQLSKIAANGHVYSFNASLAQLQKTEGKIGVEKFGINEFSVLNCFCGRHDKILFSDIENIPLVFTPRQIALLHYRSVASELYRKFRMREFTLHQIGLLRQSKKRDSETRARIKLLTTYNQGESLGLRDGREAFADCQAILKNESYDQLDAVVLRFKKMPTVMTVGGFYPEFDYGGRSQRWPRLSEQIFRVDKWSLYQG